MIKIKITENKKKYKEISKNILTNKETCCSIKLANKTDEQSLNKNK